ncbi:MAG: hypothetical protein Q9M22_05675 [Mariprofundaceae bacterium]|nr:hypothetical protein [Mariprofundaceae bacterium]
MLSINTLNLYLSNPLCWLGWSGLVFLVTYSIDQIDHSVFLGVPAFIMVPIAPWVAPSIFNLLIYTVGIFLFYLFCQKHRDWFHGSNDDINDG